MNLVLLGLLACGGAEPPPVAAPRALEARAVRWSDGPAGPVLEVAHDRYQHPDGGELLVQGAVHVADPAFFAVSTARLSGQGTVWFEGLLDDVEPADPSEDSTALTLGLQHQSDVDTDRPGWSRKDLKESDLAERMRADGVSEVYIERILVDDPGTSRSDLPDSPRGIALARLRYMHDLSRDDTDLLWKKYVLLARDAHVVAGLDPTQSAGVWFGADHLPGIGAALAEDGWTHEERGWTPAIATTYTDLALGPVQVKQLLASWRAR